MENLTVHIRIKKCYKDNHGGTRYCPVARHLRKQLHFLPDLTMRVSQHNITAAFTDPKTQERKYIFAYLTPELEKAILKFDSCTNMRHLFPGVNTVISFRESAVWM